MKGGGREDKKGRDGHDGGREDGIEGILQLHCIQCCTN